MHFRSLIILSTFSLFTMMANAKQLNIGADEWDGYTHSDGSGIYFELLKKIFPDQQLNFKVDLFNRTISAFEQQSLDIIVGAYREDIEVAIFPNWHLDYEYPIVAFYDPKVTKISKTSDFAQSSTAWLRGYRFDRFLPEIENPYLVNNITMGFDLLAKHRIDTFVDYAVNLPDKYQQQFSSFEIIPSKKIFIAFQRNKYGQKLAKEFDQGMEKLRASGELEKIYASEYDFSQLASFNTNKKNMLVLTNSVSLLRADKNTSTASEYHVNQVLQLAFSEMNNYQVDYKIIKDLSTVFQYKDLDNVCISDVIKTNDRHQHFIFSKPIAIYQGLKLYSKKQLNEVDPVNLTSLFLENTSHTLGSISGRRYGTALDKEIALLTREQLLLSPVDIFTLFKQLNNGRFQFLIEYPHITSIYWPQVSKDELYSYALNAADDFTVSHIMCSKSALGEAFIKEFDQSLTKLYQSDLFFNVQFRKISNDIKNKYIKYFNQVLKSYSN